MGKPASKSYISVIISVSLVLFILGITGLLILQAKKLSNYIKENIGVTLYLRDDVKEVDIKRLQKSLDAARYVKSTEYKDKEDAAEDLKQELGEDFISFLGYNPLSASIDVKLKAEYAHPDSLMWIEANLLENPKIKEVEYHKDLLALVHENIRKITFVLLGFSLLLLIVSIALINSTIRLAIYSRRFIIRSMQLVGATRGFITWPFVRRGLLNGFYASVIAIVLLAAVIYSAQNQVPELFDANDIELYLSLAGMVLLLGLLISWLSTSLAVRRYLNLKTDQLYR